MQILWFIIGGIVSGVFAGMGMGGGTFLIPILTIFLGVDQRISQGVNILVFLPMAVIVIIIYARKKLIDFNGWWLISLPACLVSILGAFFAFKLSTESLKIVFAVFIILIGIGQIVALLINKPKEVNHNKNK